MTSAPRTAHPYPRVMRPTLTIVFLLGLTLTSNRYHAPGQCFIARKKKDHRGSRRDGLGPDLPPYGLTPAPRRRRPPHPRAPSPEQIRRRPSVMMRERRATAAHTCATVGGRSRRSTRGDVARAPVYTRGRVNMKVVPRPRSLSTDTLPPIVSTRCFTIDSPSPVPPTSRERPESTR